MILKIKRLPLIESAIDSQTGEYLYYAVDSFSAEIYGDVFQDDSIQSMQNFILELVQACPYKIKTLILIGENKLYQHDATFRNFSRYCRKCGIQLLLNSDLENKEQQILTVLEKQVFDEWYNTRVFNSIENRRLTLGRLLNYYNWVKPQTFLGNITPGERLVDFYNKEQ